MAGVLENYGYPVATRLVACFYRCSGCFSCFIYLPFFCFAQAATDISAPWDKSKNFLAEYFRILTLFFRRKDILIIICFLLVLPLCRGAISENGRAVFARYPR